MNKNLVTIAGILVGSTIGVSQAASTSRPIMIGTTTDVLNVRSGPSTSYKVITQIKKGGTVEVYSKNSNGWYKVKYSGKEGWVNGKYIKEKFISSSPKRYLSGTRREVLRGKASTGGTTYGYIYEGESVKVIDYSGSYARVLYNNKVYYMSKQYLQKTHKTETMYVSGKAKVNLMELPSSASSVKGSILEGTSVSMVGKSGKYYHVKYNNKWYYIEKSALIKTNPVSVGYVTGADYVKVYSEDRKKVLGYISSGQKITKFTTVQGYTRIRWDGGTGVINSSSCKFSSYVKKTVNAKSVKVMSSQSSSSKQLGTFSKNEEVKVYDKSDNWSKVKIGTKYGYVENKYLSEYKYSGEKKGTPLRSTKSSSNKSNVILNIPFGEKVAVESYSNGWAKVKYGSKTGYVLNENLVLKSPIKEETEKPIGKVLVKDTDIWIRKTAEWSGEKLITVKQGEEVDLYEKGDSWSKIGYQGKIGYVSTVYLDLENISDSQEEAEMPIGKVLVKDTDIWIRKTAEWSGEKLITVKKGEEVDLYEKGYSWSKIGYQGKIGYVSTEYLDFKESSESPEETEKPIGKVLIKDTDVWIRKTAEWSGEKLITVKKGEEVDLYEKGDSWSKIGYQGKIGYVSTEYLDFEESSDSAAGPSEDEVVIGYLDTIKIVQTTVNTKYVINEGAKVYKDSGMTELIGYLRKLDTIEAISENSNGTVLCKINNSVKGYVKKENLSHRNPSAYNTETFSTRKVDKTHEEYVSSQAGRQYPTLEDIVYYSDPKNISLENKDERYQFLKLNTFRNINVYELNEYLNSIAPKGGKESVFKNQAQAFVDAARKNNIDPIYLVAHTMLETGYGFSELAQGIVVDKDSNGNSITPVKVHNLYGIGAVDSDPIGGGSRVAYALGWTDIPKAIEGAAKWISEGVKADPSIGLKVGYGYINSERFPYQYTTYSMRWDWGSGWHQYASDPQWSLKISRLMNKLSYLYEGANLEFEKIEYKESSNMSLDGNDISLENNETQIEIDAKEQIETNSFEKDE